MSAITGTRGKVINTNDDQHKYNDRYDDRQDDQNGSVHRGTFPSTGTRTYVVPLNVSRTIISIAVGVAGLYILSKRVRDGAEGRRDDRLVEVAGGDLASFPPLGRVVER